MRFTVLFVLSTVAGGCATVSQPARVADPVAIYLADYNVHSSLLLPSEGRYIEYSFGDWNYAALNHKFINDALGALMVSGESAYERRVLSPDPRTGDPVFPDKPDAVKKLYASRELINRRLEELDKRFQADLNAHASDGLIVDANNAIIFVKDPQHYGLGNNCNHLTADTFRALGYRVDGWVLANGFHLAADENALPVETVKATLSPPRPAQAEP